MPDELNNVVIADPRQEIIKPRSEDRKIVKFGIVTTQYSPSEFGVTVGNQIYRVKSAITAEILIGSSVVIVTSDEDFYIVALGERKARVPTEIYIRG